MEESYLEARWTEKTFHQKASVVEVTLLTFLRIFEVRMDFFYSTWVPAQLLCEPVAKEPKGSLLVHSGPFQLMM